jgi:hypothetical protein
MLKKIADAIIRIHRKRPTPLHPLMIKGLVRDIMTALPDELGCDECFEQLDGFVELVLAGKNAAEAMPLVQDHLERCGDCREEFQALLVALQTFA